MKGVPVTESSDTLRVVTGLFVALRGAFFVFVYMAQLLIPLRYRNLWNPMDAFPENLLLDALVRWDSRWYQSIVTDGYSLTDGQSNIAFFPGFPVLAETLAPLFGGSFLAAGLALSNTCLFLGLLALHKLVLAQAGARAAKRAVVFVLVFPSTYFFSAFYSESLFFLCVTVSMLCFSRKQMLLAGLFGLGATLTRSTGVMLAPAYVLALAYGIRFDPRRIGRAELQAFACILLIPLGMLIFMKFLDARTGDPLAFVHVQKHWERESFQPFWRAIYEDSLDPRDKYKYIEAAGSTLVLVVGLFAFRFLPLEQAVFLMLSALVPLSTGTTDSMVRYAATMVPIYPMLALATRRPDVERAVVGLFVAVAAITTIRLVAGMWGG